MANKMLPTTKEMFLDSVEFYARWMLAVLAFIALWVKLSAILDSFVGVP